MHTELRLDLNPGIRSKQPKYYDKKKVANLIRRYQELRSASEITAARYDHISTGGSSDKGKDEIVCVLADIDRGMAALSPRQLEVVRFLQLGYKINEIALVLGISTAMVKAHIKQTVLQVVSFLNSATMKKGV